MKHLGEDLRDLNANLDSIAYEFADVLRDLMRAFSSDDPKPPNVYSAARKMNSVADLLSRSKEEIGFGQLFAEALKDMH